MASGAAIIGTMGLSLAAIAWWGPIAIVGGAAGGLVVAYVVLAVAGGGGTRGRRPGRLVFERTEKTNYPVLNPTAFLVFFGVLGLIIGLAIGLSVD
jgi:hypothetical protein